MAREGGLLEEMLDGIFFGDKEVIGQGVGEDTVNFFWHGAIEAAKAGST